MESYSWIDDPRIWTSSPSFDHGTYQKLVRSIDLGQPPTDHRLLHCCLPHNWLPRLILTHMDRYGPYQSSCLDALRHVLCLNHLKPPLLVLNPHHSNHQMSTVGHHLPHCLRAKTSSRAVLAQILVRTSPEPMGQWINPQLQWNGLKCRVNG